MNFASIADKYPTERDAVVKLEDLLSHLTAEDREFTLNDLCDEVHPRTREVLAAVLGELVRQGIFEQVVRVVSPSNQGGIGDFASLEVVPKSLHDWRSDTQLEVTPANLRIIYKVGSGVLHDRSRATSRD